MALLKKRGIVIADNNNIAKTGIEIYDTNRYIRNLWEFPSDAEIVEAIEFIPSIHPDDLLLSKEERLEKVSHISYYHSPTTQDINTVKAVFTMQRDGYKCRGAMKKDSLTPEEYHYINTYIPKGLGIFGTSGCGKSTIVEIIQQMNYSGILHPGDQEKGEDYCLQIPIIKINIPANCTTKAICYRILTEIDKVSNQLNQYSRNAKAVEKVISGSYYSNTIETLLLQVKRAIDITAVGVLVLDEIHNIKCKSEKTRKLLLNFLVELSNEVRVPLLFIGTEDAITLLSEELQNGRRLCTERPIIFSGFKYDDEWDVFLYNLFTLQWIKNPMPFSEEVSRFFYEMSHGIPDVVIKVFMGAQYDAIDDESEKLSINDFILQYQKRCITIDKHLADMDERVVDYRLVNLKKKKRNYKQSSKSNDASLSKKDKADSFAKYMSKIGYSEENIRSIYNNIINKLGDEVSLEKMLSLAINGFKEWKPKENIDREVTVAGLTKVYNELDKMSRKNREQVYLALKEKGYIADKGEFR